MLSEKYNCQRFSEQDTMDGKEIYIFWYATTHTLLPELEIERGLPPDLVSLVLCSGKARATPSQ